MARIKLSLPEKFTFHTRLEVRITDINYGQHLGNDSLLSLIHEARVRFLKHHGFSEKNAGGPGLMMSDVVIQYKSQAHYGDVLCVGVSAYEPGKTTCNIAYQICREEDQQLIALAKTGMIFFDYDAQKVSRMPDVFLQLCNVRTKGI